MRSRVFRRHSRWLLRRRRACVSMLHFDISAIPELLEATRLSRVGGSEIIRWRIRNWAFVIRACPTTEVEDAPTLGFEKFFVATVRSDIICFAVRRWPKPLQRAMRALEVSRDAVTYFVDSHSWWVVPTSWIVWVNWLAILTSIVYCAIEPKLFRRHS